MTYAGGCYCGAVRYEAGGEPRFRGQCTCRECQYITGGGANLFLLMAADQFRYVQGEPKRFTRIDLDAPATREFCPDCGTHLTTRTPRDNSIVVLKVGTLDDPSAYQGPQIALWTNDKQPYHLIADGVTTFPGFPG